MSSVHKMEIHNLKIKPEYFSAVMEGIKTFELRYNDRNFQVGDSVNLKEIDDEGHYTGRAIMGKIITYILHGPCYGLQDGYCIFSFR